MAIDTRYQPRLTVEIKEFTENDYAISCGGMTYAVSSLEEALQKIADFLEPRIIATTRGGTPKVSVAREPVTWEE